MAVLDKITEALGGSILGGVKELITIWKVPPEVALAHQAETERIAANMQAEVLKAVEAEVQGQNETNKIEAANAKIFISGWRPFVGWVCGAGLAIQFVLAPVLSFLAALCGFPVVFPPLELSVMVELLTGMLGMGGFRTYEKLKGVASK